MGDLQHRLLGAGTADDERMRLRIRPWPQHRQLERPVFAVMFDRPARPGLQHDRLGLLEALLRLLGRDVVALVVVDVVRRAAAQSRDDPPLGDVVEQRDLLGQADRVVQRDLRDGEADLDAAGRGGQRGGKAERIDVGADAVEMVLGQPQGVEAKLLRQPGLGDGLVDHALVLSRVAAFREQEIAEFHVGLLWVGSAGAPSLRGYASGATPT